MITREAIQQAKRHAEKREPFYQRLGGHCSTACERPEGSTSVENLSAAVSGTEPDLLARVEQYINAQVVENSEVHSEGEFDGVVPFLG